MKLYIAEKPSLARAIIDALPTPHHKAEGCVYVGHSDKTKCDVVSWCIGHILEQAEAFTSQQHFIDVIEQDDGIFFSETKFEVVVKVSKNIAPYFKRRNVFPNQIIEKELESGELLISAKVATNNQILPLIKYWVPEIHVISPVEVKNQLFTDLTDYTNK